jgi:hypothetical protein
MDDRGDARQSPQPIYWLALLLTAAAVLDSSHQQAWLQTLVLVLSLIEAGNC